MGPHGLPVGTAALGVTAGGDAGVIALPAPSQVDDAGIFVHVVFIPG